MSNAPSESRAHRGLALTPRTILSAVIVIVVVVFIALNRDTTKISFGVATVHAALWTALTICGALGLLAGYLLGRRSR